MSRSPCSAPRPPSCSASTGSGPGERVWLCAAGACPAAGQWFYIAGILNPVPASYAPEINTAVLVGFPAAERYLGLDGHPSEIYVRTTPDNQAATTAVDSLLGAQADPENPGYVTVSQPSAALTAQADAKGALDTLFLGLGAVALLVGAIGVANIMIISVLERRQEIGLRRALGATRGQIRAQFLAEATLLSLAGGVAGVLLGATAVIAYARSHSEPAVIPVEAWAAVWPPPCSSAPSPDYSPPSAPPASPQPKHSGASECEDTARAQRDRSLHWAQHLGSTTPRHEETPDEPQLRPRSRAAMAPRGGSSSHNGLPSSAGGMRREPVGRCLGHGRIHARAGGHSPTPDACARTACRTSPNPIATAISMWPGSVSSQETAANRV